MTTLLIRCFVRDSKNIRDSAVRMSYGLLASVVGIVCNILLFGAKFCIGLMLGSLSVMADSFNNLSDSLSSVVTLVGFRFSSKPADEEHPFGHGRIEYISTLIVSGLIMLMGYEFFKSSFLKILDPTPLEDFNAVTICVLLLTILVKIWLSLFSKRIGLLIQSKSLEATALDARNDVLVTSVAIVSLLISRFTGVFIDGFAGMIVAVVLFKGGYDLAKEGLTTLIGEPTDPLLAARIKELVEKYDGIIGTHDLIVHSYGPNLSMATIHAEVPSHADMLACHETIDRAEKEIANELGIFLVIHMDPIEIDDVRVNQISTIVREALESIDLEINAHDFRIVDGKEKIQVIFDLMFPHAYTAERRKNIVKKLQSLLMDLNGKYTCVINVESSFIAARK